MSLKTNSSSEKKAGCKCTSCTSNSWSDPLLVKSTFRLRCHMSNSGNVIRTCQKSLEHVYSRSA